MNQQEQHWLNCKEIDEALSDLNKYYFWKENGRSHNNVDELLQFYCDNQGYEHLLGHNHD